MSESGGTNYFEYDLYDAYANGNILERFFHTIRLKEIKSLLEDKNNCILDYGCNTGAILINLLKKGYSVEGFDISQNNIESCLYYANIQGLNPILYLNELPSSCYYKYQMILLTNVLEYVSDKKIVVSNIERLLAKKGKVLVCIAMPRHPFIMLNRLRASLSGRSLTDINNSEPLSKLDEFELLDLFQSCGFKIIRAKYGILFINKYFVFQK